MKDLKYLQDILGSIEAIENFQVIDYDDFVEDSRTQDAVFYNLIIIGEAANRISDSFREKHPQIPWSSMIGTRNVIVHGYDQVKAQIVWDIIQRDLEGLKIGIQKIIGEL